MIDISTRSMPVCKDTEKAVLSCMLLDPAKMIDEATLCVTSDSFYMPRHRTIFEAIIAMHSTGGKVDIVTLTSYLRDREQLDSVGGTQFVSDLLDELPTTNMFNQYVEILKSKQILRSVIQLCNTANDEAYRTPESSVDFLNGIESKFREITDNLMGRLDDRTMSWKEISASFIDRLQDRYEASGEVGLSSGLNQLDALTGRFRGGEMIMLSAKPSHGKSAFGVQLAMNMASAGKNVLMISGEMPQTEVADRCYANKSGVLMSKIRQPKTMGKLEFPKVIAATEKTQDWRLSIDDTPQMKIDSIPGVCRRIESRLGRKLDAVFVDYLQRLQPANPKEQRERQIADMAQRLKTLAREFDIPVFVLAQVNEDGAIRESKVAEQEADIIWKLEQDQGQIDRGEMTRDSTLKQSKGRNSGTGQIDMKFYAPELRFVEKGKGEF